MVFSVISRPVHPNKRRRRKRRDPIEIQLLEECFLFSGFCPLAGMCVSNPTKSFPFLSLSLSLAVPLFSYKHMQEMPLTCSQF
jgi:hypothetical protein